MNDSATNEIFSKERLSEISSILAQGIIRLHQAYASSILHEEPHLSGGNRDSSVDFPFDRSGDAHRQNRSSA